MTLYKRLLLLQHEAGQLLIRLSFYSFILSSFHRGKMFTIPESINVQRPSCKTDACRVIDLVCYLPLFDTWHSEKKWRDNFSYQLEDIYQGNFCEEQLITTKLQLLPSFKYHIFLETPSIRFILAATQVYLSH